MKRSDLLQARLRLDINPVAMELHMTSDLEVVLLLTHEGIV